MPRAPRLCGYRDCPQVATIGARCATHKQMDDERAARYTATHRQPDIRPSSSQRGYGAAWRILRAQVLREEPQCRRCGAPSTRADHIVPRTQGGTDARSNLQGLCEPCHNRKTVTEDGGLVFGRSTRKRMRDDA